MSAYSQDGAPEVAAPGPAVSSGWRLSRLRRTRIALLSGAMAILLLGAAAAGAFAYLMIIRGTPATTTGSVTGR
jgi:hypothetical protein